MSSFLERARKAIETQILPRLKEKLEQKVERSHIPRLLHSDRDEPDDPYELLLSRRSENSDGPPRRIKDEGLLDLGSTIVCGKGGTGKSVLSLHLAIRACERFLSCDDAPFPVHVELGAETNAGSTSELKTSLNRVSKSLYERALTEHPPGLLLIADALDEMIRYDARQRMPLDVLLDELAGKGPFSLLLTTRRSQWNEIDWMSDVIRDAPRYNLDNAQHFEYKEILGSDAKFQSFRKTCERKGLASLLQIPFDGFDLAFRYADGDPLPNTRRHHLDQRIDQRLKPDGMSSGRSAVSPSKLRRLASTLAYVMTFTREDALAEDDVRSVLSNPVLTNTGREASGEDVKELLASRLFKSVDAPTGKAYSFDHFLYREALTADALTSLSLRKQRQLLFVDLEGNERVATVHRGIARMLTERDSDFRDALLATDFPVAFFGSLTTLSEEKREAFLHEIFQWAIDRHLSPWSSVPGTGESFEDVIGLHRLASPTDFLRTYLTQDHIIARRWGIYATANWNAGARLTAELEALALNEDAASDVRRHALEILQKQGESALSTIRRLLLHDDDTVRGAALGAYRRIASPSPTRYLQLIQKEKQNPELYSALISEVESYGRSLSDDGVVVVLHHLHAEGLRKEWNGDSRYVPILDLKACLMSGILQRDRLPDVHETSLVPVLLRCALSDGLVNSSNGSGRNSLRVRETVSDSLMTAQFEKDPSLWRNLFLHVYDHLELDSFRGSFRRKAGDLLITHIPDKALHLLPNEVTQNQATPRQLRFLQRIRRSL